MIWVIGYMKKKKKKENGYRHKNGSILEQTMDHRSKPMLGRRRKVGSWLLLAFLGASLIYLEQTTIEFYYLTISGEQSE